MPIDRLEIVVNGSVVASQAVPGGTSARIAHEAVLEKSSWVAARPLPPMSAAIRSSGCFERPRTCGPTWRGDGALRARFQVAGYCLRFSSLPHVNPLPADSSR